jgi:hypothetical protein
MMHEGDRLGTRPARAMRLVACLKMGRDCAEDRAVEVPVSEYSVT